MTSLTGQASGVLMPYGKHRGKDIADVPLDYLTWFLVNCKVGFAVRAAIAEVLNPQKFTVNAPVPTQELSDLAEAAEKTGRTLAAVIEKKIEGEKKRERKNTRP